MLMSSLNTSKLVHCLFFSHSLHSPTFFSPTAQLKRLFARLLPFILSNFLFTTLPHPPDPCHVFCFSEKNLTSYLAAHAPKIESEVLLVQPCKASLRRRRNLTPASNLRVKFRLRRRLMQG